MLLFLLDSTNRQSIFGTLSQQSPSGSTSHTTIHTPQPQTPAIDQHKPSPSCPKLLYCTQPHKPSIQPSHYHTSQWATLQSQPSSLLSSSLLAPLVLGSFRTCHLLAGKRNRTFEQRLVSFSSSPCSCRPSSLSERQD